MERFAEGSPQRDVQIPLAGVAIEGMLGVPDDAPGVVVFAHGSGSGRFSPRNQYVAGLLREAGIGTLLIDLLTPQEEMLDLQTAELRFDIPLLARRVVGATDWLMEQPSAEGLPIGYFGASTGAAAALVAAAQRPGAVTAVVSRGGRPDLAGESLPRVQSPTLLIVGQLDTEVIQLNRQAQQRMTAKTDLAIVSGAAHLFEEPGKLEEVSRLSIQWFRRYLRPSRQAEKAA